MSMISTKTTGNEAPMTTKLTPEDFAALRAATARLQAEALAKGLSYHYSENGRIMERRPDGSAHEVSGPVNYDCGYDPAPIHLNKQA